MSVILVSLSDNSSMGFRGGHYPMVQLLLIEPAEIHWFVEVGIMPVDVVPVSGMCVRTYDITRDVAVRLY